MTETRQVGSPREVLPRGAILALVGVCLAQVAGMIAVHSIPGAPVWAKNTLGVTALITTPAQLVLIGLGLTWLTRRKATRSLLHGADEPTVLSGRTLVAVRFVVLSVFVAATVLYVADAFALWDEAHRLQTADRYGDPREYYGLTLHERQLLTGTLADVPGWYPVFVVGRQLLLDGIAIGVAWLIFSRRPTHWMAYLSTLFIIVAPWTGHLIRGADRLDGTSLEGLSGAFTLIAIVTLAAFLWLFPDGRFRRTFVTYITGMVLFFFAMWGLWSIVLDEGEDPGGTAVWLTLMLGFLIFGIGGVSLQLWRYRHTPLADRRLARWNLVLLAAIPLWFLPFEALHDFYGEDNDVDDGLDGFVWEQVHETMYLAAPVLLGIWVLYLVRRQGWWDFQTLWNRTAIYGIGLAALALLYAAAFGMASLAAAPLGDPGEGIVAVLGATAAVAFAYGPLLARVRGWVDARWFPRRIEVDRVITGFGDEVRRTTSPDTLPTRLRSVVADSVDTDDVRLWMGPGGERS